MLKLDPQKENRQDLFKHMLAAIGPRPIALASTIDTNENPNLAPFSFFNIFGINPPTLIFSPSRSGRNSKTKDSFDNVKEIPEVVINIVTNKMVHQTNLSSVAYKKGTNEFEKAGFTQIDSEIVKPFRVKESPVQIECKVNQVIETGTGGGAGNLVICEIVMVHVDKNMIGENGFIDTRKLELIGRMGGNYWCKAYGDAIFEVKKPSTEIGIGVDQIPLDIRYSTVLTGNDLGQLGMFSALPDDENIAREKNSSEVQQIFKEFGNDNDKLKNSIHILAKSLINSGDIDRAWNVLMTLYS